MPGSKRIGKVWVSPLFKLPKCIGINMWGLVSLERISGRSISGSNSTSKYRIQVGWGKLAMKEEKNAASTSFDFDFDFIYNEFTFHPLLYELNQSLFFCFIAQVIIWKVNMLLSSEIGVVSILNNSYKNLPVITWDSLSFF